MHPISPHVWLAIIAIGLAVAAFLMFVADYEARHSITATRTATMNLYHIDSLTGPEELHIWCDSFDNAWRWAMLTDTFKIQISAIFVCAAFTRITTFAASTAASIPPPATKLPPRGSHDNVRTRH